MAYRFKKHKLGPVIGKRPGAAWWAFAVRCRWWTAAPQQARVLALRHEGKQWIIEGTGVEPDIVVDNDPAREFAGIDDQLERGIEVIKKLLVEHPVRLPPPPPFLDKSK